MVLSDADCQFEIDRQLDETLASNEGLINTVAKLIDLLPLGAPVLDTACGHGRPVSQMLADADFEDHGLGTSRQSISAAGRAAIRDLFSKTSMTDYEPPSALDAVISAMSLPDSTYSEVQAEVMWYIQWLQRGGFLMLGDITGELEQTDASVFDRESGCCKRAGFQYMGSDQEMLLMRSHGWQKLLKEFDMEIIHTVVYGFKPPDERCRFEAQRFIIAKKGDRNPVIGPYPYPKTYRGPHL